MFGFTHTRGSWSGAVPFELAGGGRFVMPRREFVPAYLKTYEEGRLIGKVEGALQLLRNCHVCPRDCEVNRLENKTGVCKSGRLARVTSAFTHFGEEDCLRGWNGSGTIFFAWCNLRCVFCQNFETSQQGDGAEVTARQLAAVMLRLQELGCHNINFVTPDSSPLPHCPGSGHKSSVDDLEPSEVHLGFFNPARTTSALNHLPGFINASYTISNASGPILICPLNGLSMSASR